MPSQSHAKSGPAFLLTQLGTRAAMLFAERVAALDLTPPQVGMLRMIGVEAGLSQQQLAGRLGMLPSKVVSFVDELESRGLVARTRSARDRRVYELTLTDKGEELMRQVWEVAAEHDADFCGPLDTAEREQLAGLLRRLAEHHDLTPGVHPGYRHLG
ncbi:DNA-binding MarR family transcriptional regulator [Saccharopolyspora erythraea NRRL 2338]|uniref:Transcriptional regulator, MarR family n=2 Tax=Saccharopolyspora erythraea TaxID=1836 RepID=A4FQ81_SACEN|nr:MarR family transcriptional regulator [Saccharopolyspora erythraea]EQD86303.1 MarR family transcriptional regulator [Saccharopolyspora erythraea D]PFG92806.1 DNA-binding MarR family transcriptional regulator [Saccharopolyspora erythraea NRRL 2338]QRK89721.1 MarR family transcriptional regulator [Saccharopolyspora erythraea]CAM06206.1 transcriptional regulator, MarR family [Saccharopolyspora erythraea NRRL 2338]